MKKLLVVMIFVILLISIFIYSRKKIFKYSFEGTQEGIITKAQYNNTLGRYEYQIFAPKGKYIGLVQNKKQGKDIMDNFHKNIRTTRIVYHGNFLCAQCIEIQE